MRFKAAAISAAVFLAAIAVMAQLKRNADENLVARLSYSNTLMEYSGDQARQVCFALYKSGLYRLWRPNPVNLKPGDPDPAHVMFEGALTKEQMRQMGAMLKQLNLSSHQAGFVEQGAESFLVEMVNGSRTEQLKWVNPDHRRAFPPPITRVVDWMQDFQPQDAVKVTLRDLSDISVCPSANENPLPLRASVQ